MHPRKLTFIDGRGAGWPQFPEHQIVTSGLNGIEDVFQKYNITYIVTKAADSSGTVLPLINYVAARGDWELVFADGLMLVFVKNTPENRHIIEKHRIPKGILSNHIVAELVHYTFLGVNKQFVYSMIANYLPPDQRSGKCGPVHGIFPGGVPGHPGSSRPWTGSFPAGSG